MNRHIIVALAVVAGAVLVASMATVTIAAQEGRTATLVAQSLKYMDYKDGVFKVMAGGGGPIAPLTAFFPQVANIKAGESVVWYNPSNVGEPHTITFILDSHYWANLEAPFVVKNVEGFEPLTPGENSEAITFPGPQGDTVIVALNARATMPTRISSDGTVTPLPPNATYTMDGTEKYVNSGFLWPEGMTPPGLPEIDTFTVTFEQPGTYSYICVIHPWQAGQVVVE